MHVCASQREEHVLISRPQGTLTKIYKTIYDQRSKHWYAVQKSAALCVIFHFCINVPFVSLDTQRHGDERMMDGNR